jgi:hypothetical protein
MTVGCAGGKSERADSAVRVCTESESGGVRRNNFN